MPRGFAISLHLQIVLVLLAIDQLQGETVRAVPIPSLQHRSSSSCADLQDCRTIWNIVSSCIVTIFSCIWVAVHPNLPDIHDCSWKVTWRRAKVMLLALIAPELIIVFAFRQRVSAHRFAKRYKDRGWTKTHGFFAVMGGFLLYDNDVPVRVLYLEDFDDPSIDFPDVTEVEIQDRSKGDALSKGLAIVQTSWFILQCIGRAAERLPITELEIASLAFAVLNFGTYVLWWDKPLNVLRPIRVYRKGHGERVGSDQGQISAGGQEESVASPSEDGEVFLLLSGDDEDIWVPIKSPHVPSRWIAFKKKVVELVKATFEAFIMVVFTTVMMDLREWNPKPMTRVATFHSGRDGPDSTLELRVRALFTTGVAFVFGAIHGIAWSFDFPTTAERTVWRVSSIITMCAPVLIASWYANHWLGRRISSAWGWLTQKTGLALPIAMCLLYLFSRLALLVEAFTTLRLLPDGAYQTVIWTTFIPHL